MNKKGDFTWTQVATAVVVVLVIIVVVLIFQGRIKAGSESISDIQSKITSRLEGMDLGEMTSAQKETLEHNNPKLYVKKLYESASKEPDLNEKYLTMQKVISYAEENKDKGLIETTEYYSAQMYLGDNKWLEKKDFDSAKYAISRYNIALNSKDENQKKIAKTKIIKVFDYMIEESKANENIKIQELLKLIGDNAIKSSISEKIKLYSSNEAKEIYKLYWEAVDEQNPDGKNIAFKKVVDYAEENKDKGLTETTEYYSASMQLGDNFWKTKGIAGIAIQYYNRVLNTKNIDHKEIAKNKIIDILKEKIKQDNNTDITNLLNLIGDNAIKSEIGKSITDYKERLSKS